MTHPPTDPSPGAEETVQLCYAGDAPAVGECTSCGQPHCARHAGQPPRLDWCAECVANAKVEEALGWTFNGCALGCVGGVLVWLAALLLVPALAFGPGRGFVIVVSAALVGAIAAYVVRRNQLFRAR